MMDGRAGHAVGVGVALAIVAASSNAWCADDERPHRDVIPVEETHGAPQGFHSAKETRWGLIIGGSSCLAVGALSLITGFQQRAENNRNTGATPDPGSGGEFFLISGAIATAAGIPLLAYGLLSPRDVYVRDRPQTISLGINPNPRSWGASLNIAF